MDEFKIDVNGGVRSAGTFHYGEGLTLGDALLLAGGMVQESGGGKVEISRVVDYDAGIINYRQKELLYKHIQLQMEASFLKMLWLMN